MNRRDFLRSAALWPLAGSSPAVFGSGRVSGVSRVFVPGYEPGQAYANGRKLLAHPGLARALGNRPGGEKSARLLTRVALDGAVLQALFPVHGHGVAISPDRQLGVFCGFEAGNHAAFDPETLDMLALAPSLDIGWRGGGHAVFAADGHVLLSERAPRAALYGDSPAKGYGRVSIRDPRTLAIVDSYSSFGIDPHDLCFLDGGRLLAIANYGSVPVDGEVGLGVPRHVIEACIAVIDTDSGRLVEKFGGATANAEIRHLAAAGDGRVCAIQALLGDDAALAAMHAGDAIAYPVDITAEPGVNYLPASPLLLAAGRPAVGMGAGRADEAFMRHGLSIICDQQNQQFIASFPSSHCLFVFDARDGSVLRRIDTRSRGLQHPCGIALLPDGRHYVVTGYQRGLHLYETGSHRWLPEASLHTDFFGHSHIAIA